MGTEHKILRREELLNKLKGLQSEKKKLDKELQQTTEAIKNIEKSIGR